MIAGQTKTFYVLRQNSAQRSARIAEIAIGYPATDIPMIKIASRDLQRTMPRGHRLKISQDLRGLFLEEFCMQRLQHLSKNVPFFWTVSSVLSPVYLHLLQEFKVFVLISGTSDSPTGQVLCRLTGTLSPAAKTFFVTWVHALVPLCSVFSVAIFILDLRPLLPPSRYHVHRSRLSPSFRESGCPRPIQMKVKCIKCNGNELKFQTRQSGNKTGTGLAPSIDTEVAVKFFLESSERTNSR